MKSKKVEFVIGVIMILVMFYVGVGILGPAQDKQITEYCIDNPNESTHGDLIIDCGEWLEDHPELVEEGMVERERGGTMIKYPYKTQSYNEERGNWIVFTHEAENVVKYHYSDEKEDDA